MGAFAGFAVGLMILGAALCCATLHMHYLRKTSTLHETLKKDPWGGKILFSHGLWALIFFWLFIPQLPVVYLLGILLLMANGLRLMLREE